ncbi:unnamed protein product [Lactuca virosa]|uniref:Uncharacterized protein n=1 Tax=Lactuca virosa TaxID=75947 RepID=A0AAU9NEE0_9ASTR|nr:unnamed protein product [Lactuca virosa]
MFDADAPILNETSPNAASASPDTSSTVVLSSAVHLLDRLPSLELQFKYSPFIQPNIDIEGNRTQRISYFQDSAFDTTQALSVSQVLGVWQCANSVAYLQDSPPNSVVQEVIRVDGVEKLLVREKEHLVLLRKNLWSSIKETEDGEKTCCEHLFQTMI